MIKVLKRMRPMTLQKNIRSLGMSTSDYVIKLKQWYFKVKLFYMERLNGV